MYIYDTCLDEWPDQTLLRFKWSPTKQTMHCKNLQKLSPVAPKNFEKYESYLLEVQNLFWTLWCHWCLEVQVLMCLQSSMSQGHHSKTVLLSCFVLVSPQMLANNKYFHIMCKWRMEWSTQLESRLSYLKVEGHSKFWHFWRANEETNPTRYSTKCSSGTTQKLYYRT